MSEPSAFTTPEAERSEEPRLPEAPGDVTFKPPKEGTPAAKALAANAALKVSKVTKGLHKLRGLKRPKMKNLNIVKQVYKHTKRKRKKRHFSRTIKGKVIEGVDELYTLTAGIMLGIRVSIGYTVRDPSQLLTVEDFSYVQKISFPASGNSKGTFATPPHALVHTFKFKTYAPKVFDRLRDFFGIPSVTYMLSVCGNYNFLEFISNSKSGQFFFYSHDGKYMIKTQTKEENKFLKRILPHYYKYLVENPHSTLVRILAMHRVKMYHLRRKVHFVIMSSVFDTLEEIHTIYDLKGSLIGRAATAKEKASGGVLKDQDLLAAGQKFHLGVKKEAFIEQLRRDANFLASLNIMDYSLLVGIHDRTRRVVVEEGEEEAVGASRTPFRRKQSEAEAAVASNSGEGVGDGGGDGNETLAAAVAGSGSMSPHSPVDQVGNHHREEDADGNSESDGSSGEQHDSSDDEPEVDVEDVESVAYDEGDSDSELGDADACGAGGVGGNDGGRSSFGPACGLPTLPENSTAELPRSPAGGRGSVPANGSSSSLEAQGVDKLLGLSSGLSSAHGSSGALLERGNTPGLDASLPVRGGGGSLFGSPAPTTDGGGGGVRFSAIGGVGMGADEGECRPTFGLGATRTHPWTMRADSGVNSRLSNGQRGDEIYFMGIIDILQQYNYTKFTENKFKGLIQDRTKISAVDAKFYAERFVKFMEENMD